MQGTPTQRGAVGVGAANPDRRGAECERLHHVRAGADTGVEQHRYVRHRLRHVSQTVDRGQPAVGLPAAVSGDVDAVDALVDSPAGVVGMATPLSRIGSVVNERSHARSAQTSGRQNISAQVRIAVPGSSSGDFSNRLRKTGSEKYVCKQRPLSCGKFDVDRSRGRQLVTRVSRVTTIPR